MGKKGRKWRLVKRLTALSLCVLWLAATPVFALGGDSEEDCSSVLWEEVLSPEEAAPLAEENLPEPPSQEEAPVEGTPGEETPELETPEEETPEEETPEEETPEEETPEEETPELETPEEETPEEETPEEETPEEETPELETPGEETSEEETSGEKMPEKVTPEEEAFGEEISGTENGIHIPACGEGCTGEDCACPCHPEEAADSVEMTFLERLLAAESCRELFGLFQAEENAPAILALTAEEIHRVQAHAQALPDDGWQEDALEVLEMLRGLLETDGEEDAVVLATATISSRPQNAIVAYAYRKASDESWTWGGTYTGNFDISYSSSYGTEEEYYVFFVKPAENYLLTQFSVVNDSSGSTSYDLYSIDCTTSRINTYPDFAALVAQAKAQGYLGFNGYRSSAAGNVTLNQYFTGQRPALDILAEAEPDHDVKPGDTVQFTVTLTPQTVAGSSCKGFRLTGLTINGRTYTDVPLTENADGSYTAVVTYTATAADWLSGDITLNADANVTYEYILPVTDRNNNGSRITTTSTITSTGTTTVRLASDYGVGYTLRFETPEGVQPPAGIPQAPVDNLRYFAGSDVTVKEYDGTPVDDSENGGTWTFDGWYRDDQGPYAAGDGVTMPKGGLQLVGIWRFEQYPTATVTIRKLVTGNLGDTTRAFVFRVTGNTYGEAGKTDEFLLKHGEEKTITVNRGDTVTISEDCGDYAPSYWLDGTERDGNEATLTVTENCQVIFYNYKEVPIETGVSLDWAPFALLLGLAGTGIAVLYRRKA